MELINLERKNEYTNYLVNLLSPIFYDGINSIYKDGIKHTNKGEELKIFQSLLKSIPEWKADILNEEINRIKLISNCDYLENLVKAVIKANLSILSNTNNIKKELYDIKLNDFIHNCYISIAKDIYQYPELFYHDFKAIDIKRNQRESIQIIKESIKNSIRKMIPINLILEDYLYDKKTIHNDIISNNNIKQLINDELKLNLKGGDIIDKNTIEKINSEKINSPTNDKYSFTEIKTNNNKNPPKLVSDIALEDAYSTVRTLSSTTNTTKILESIKNNILSSQNSSDNINTIHNSSTKIDDTSISYNISNNDNYLTVFNNN